MLSMDIAYFKQADIFQLAFPYEGKCELIVVDGQEYFRSTLKSTFSDMALSIAMIFLYAKSVEAICNVYE